MPKLPFNWNTAFDIIDRAARELGKVGIQVGSADVAANNPVHVQPGTGVTFEATGASGVALAKDASLTDVQAAMSGGSKAARVLLYGADGNPLVLATSSDVQAVRDRLPAALGNAGGLKAALVDLGGAATELMVQAIRDRLPTALGQALAGACLPVVLPTSQVGGALALDATISGAGAMTGWDYWDNGGSAIGAGAVVKASPGTFGGTFGFNQTGSPAFIQIHNAATVAAISASTLVAVSNATITNTGYGALNSLAGGIKCTNGIVIVWSTNGSQTGFAAGTSTAKMGVYYK